jgi:hypothetical protein
MDGSSEFPSRPEMESSLAEFVRVALPCPSGTAAAGRRHAPRARASSSRRATGSTAVVRRVRRRCCQGLHARLAGSEHVAHYVATRAPETYAGRRLFIIGKQNSGFELASGLLSWASRIVLASPRPAKLSVQTNSLAGIRARYVQPVEDRFMGGGVFILDAAIDGVERVGESLLVRTRASDGSGSLDVEADEVIAATGFTAPLLDRLPSALPHSARVDCLPRHRTGRAPRCPTSTSRHHHDGCGGP